MASDSFEGIDGKARTEFMKIEEHISYRFRNLVLLLESLQFPGSFVRWNDSKDSTGLRVVGGYIICPPAASVGYCNSGLSKIKL